jgi:hypothetical protein
VTTDYRRVFSELLIRRMGNNKLGTVFPGYGGYSPLGIVQGADIAPQYAVAGAMAPSARLPDHVQPRYGESLESVAPEAPAATPTWRKRGKVDRKLIRRGL